MNNVKIYGADGGRFGSSIDGQERFWRNIFGGMASVRFHRPASGLGISKTVQTHLASSQRFMEEFNVFSATPSNEFIEDREDNEAYGLVVPGKSHAVFFPGEGEVTIGFSNNQARMLKWLNILESQWVYEPVDAASELSLSPPDPGMWVAIIDMQE